MKTREMMNNMKTREMMSNMKTIKKTIRIGQ
jgi:hypothetical protein